MLFGPHETNLGRGRAISERHVAYYARRAAGGCGVVVTETASVHVSDHPYERAPLAADCGPGWADVVAACRPHGALLLASLGHTGAQGSSGYGQTALWAPSAVPDVATREVPVAMERADVDAVVAGFAAGTRVAVGAGVDGVEIDAGARSLLRQFASGLTNHRGDAYGADRLRLLREVLAAVRAELGRGRVLALRLRCDEEAPWAGITPSLAVEHVRELAPLVDLLVVVRGSGLTPSAYRPDGHTRPGFNAELTRSMRAAAGGTPVVLQGSVVDVAAAHRALDDGVADAVEMTRAQIADADLVGKARTGVPVRPCTLCNQACQVRDVRNPLVSCIADPSEEGALPELLAAAGREVTLVTRDAVVGERLGGDLAPANARLARAGVRRETSAVLRSAGDGIAVLADRWTEEERSVPCAVVVDAGPGLPGVVPPGALAAGDAVAPRTVLEAVLEGRRAARALLAAPPR